ncbi:unnamed protein product, partial [Coregonus sp. 'balchen']
SANQARWVTGNRVSTKLFRPAVARWNFQRLADLKQCDVVQILHPYQLNHSPHSCSLLPPHLLHWLRQLQSQQSSAVVFNLPAALVPPALAMKRETFEDSQMD